MTLPALVVKLDDGTGTFPFDISSKVMGVDGYDVSRGRDDWQGAVTAGELGLTLNNSDGRFTPGSTILASPSPIKVDQRIRVIEYVGDGFGVDGFGTGPFGGYVIRCTGYVKSWPVSWPATVATFSTVSLTATDAQARAERRTLRSMLEEEILSLTATVYYTLGETEGATSAGDTAGTQHASLVPTGPGAALTFGTGMGPVDGLTALQLFGGQYLSGLRISPATATVLVFVATTASNIGLGGLPGVAGASLRVNASGKVEMFVGTSSVGSSATSVNDGRTRAIAWRFGSDPTAGVYVDGIQEIAATFFSPLFFSFLLGADIVGSSNFIGTMSHFALIHPTGAADIAAVSAAAQGFAGESGTARIARIAGYAGISVGTVDTSLTVAPGQDIAGRSAQDAIQEVADAEMGLVFIDGSGNLTFHNRNRVRSKTVPDLILDSQYVTPDVQPVTDDQQIVNYFEATAAGTGAVSVVQSTTSETSHGRYPVSQTYLVQTDAEAVDRASWIVAKQAEPTARFGTLTINLYKMTAAMAANVVAALDLNCWLRVTSMATQTPGGTVVDVVVQGWRVTAAGESWAITCNVVARALYTAFVLDSTLLDSTTPLAV